MISLPSVNPISQLSCHFREFKSKCVIFIRSKKIITIYPCQRTPYRRFASGITNRSKRTDMFFSSILEPQVHDSKYEEI